jgi:peptide/nickel transport system substrate-binding protein
MRGSNIRTSATVAMAAVLCAAVVALPAGAQDSGESEENEVLRVGWAQVPQTLNPFVGQDEEAYTIWALTFDLLVNFSPEDLSPAPGIAESWEVSEDRRTVTFTLDPEATWSDGEPITSADVKYSLETLGGEGILFTGYTDNISSIETPDDQTVVVETKRPDARIVGGLFIYMLPEHVWGEVPLEELTGSYQPELPMVGSGPFVVTEYDRERILRMEKNPEWGGPEPEFDEIHFIRYGNQDAAERALQLGEVDLVPEVGPANFERLGTEDNIETLRASSPAYTQLAFNMCPADLCPDAEFNPAIQDRTVRQAIAYAVDRERINAIASKGTAFPGHGILPDFYRSFYEVPETDYPYDPDLANQMLDDAGWVQEGDGPRTKGGEELSFDLYVRSESPSTVQAARLIEEMTAEIGVDFSVQVVSTDKLYDLTIRKVDGEPAPDFDTFIWGWGGDPYDPSFLLSILTTEQIGGSSDAFYSNPEYDRLFDEQAGVFDVAERKEIIQQMVAITQRDLPYLVLTYDPNLQAYRTDRLANVEPVCPAGETGDVFCDQVSYEPLLSLAPGSSSSDDDGGFPTGLLIVAAVLVLGGIGYAVVRARRREGEPLELQE